MQATHVLVRRVSAVSTRPFDEVVHRLTATVGRPDMAAFRAGLVAATTLAAVEALVERAVGMSGLMEFVRFDAGAVLRKAHGGHGPRILRIVLGNPLVMKDMVQTVPDVASYAPTTILVDERADGVHVSYDLMESQIAPYGSEPALAVARVLDAKIQSLLETAAA